MRVIKPSVITDTVAKLCAHAAINTPPDAMLAYKKLRSAETGRAKNIFDLYIQNAALAPKNNISICQDTGIVIVFLEIGRDARVDGDVYAAINAGVAKGYTKNYLRASVVSDPLFERKNTRDNTPAIIYTTITEGDKIKITLLPKGAGAENMSALKMFTPADGPAAVKDFVLETVTRAGANACPPLVIGVGIGGSFEACAVLAKKALTRTLGSKNPSKKYAAFEAELLTAINKLGIGPQGFGGKATAMGVNIEYAPCHMASLPVAVNIGCYVHRHAGAVI